jgi:hypothetical protein
VRTGIGEEVLRAAPPPQQSRNHRLILGPTTI